MTMPIKTTLTYSHVILSYDISIDITYVCSV